MAVFAMGYYWSYHACRSVGTRCLQAKRGPCDATHVPEFDKSKTSRDRASQRPSKKHVEAPVEMATFG
jgi:hypothetical protein